MALSLSLYLDGDQQPELCLGGSWGLWRFFVNSQVIP